MIDPVELVEDLPKAQGIRPTIYQGREIKKSRDLVPVPFFCEWPAGWKRAGGCGQRCRARKGSQTCELDLRRSAAIHQSVCRVTRLYAPLARSIITLTQFAAELVRRALQSIARCEVSPVDDAGSAAVLYVVSKCEGKCCRPTVGARTRMSCMDVGADALMRRHPCSSCECARRLSDGIIFPRI